MPDEANGVNDVAVTLDRVQRDLNLVREQVDLLQIAAADKKKPRWRPQTSLVISVISLVLSATFSIYTDIDQSRQRRLEDQKRKLASIDSVLTEIVGIRTEDTKQLATLGATNFAAYRAWNSAVNTKRLMLLATAINIAREMPKEVSPVIDLTIGVELISDGRFVDAKEFIEKGIASAKASNQPTTFLLSALAHVYILPGSPLYQPDRGRKLYLQAIDSFINQTDYNTLNSKVNLMLYWASNEVVFKNQKAADGLLASAEKLVTECQLPELGKAPLRSLIDGARIRLSAQASPVNLYDTSKWLGDWEVSYSDSHSGGISFFSMPGGAFANFSKEQVSSGTLMARQTGMVLISSASKIRLDWNSALAVGPNGPFQVAGYSLAELTSKGNLRGHDYQLGAPVKDWIARRTSTQRLPARF